jgi:hypothetical protein
MKELTQEKVLSDIEKFKNEWKEDGSWWFGSTESFTNAEYGYDVNTEHNQKTNKIDVIVYDLVFTEKKGKYSQSKLEIAKECLFKFEIERKEPTNFKNEILKSLIKNEGIEKILQDGNGYNLNQDVIKNNEELKEFLELGLVVEMSTEVSNENIFDIIVYQNILEDGIVITNYEYNVLSFKITKAYLKVLAEEMKDSLEDLAKIFLSLTAKRKKLYDDEDYSGAFELEVEQREIGEQISNMILERE